MGIKSIYGRWLWLLTEVAGIDTAKKFDARFRFNRKLNLKNPCTLADKVSYIELHQQSPLAPTCTDKYAVRKYIEEKGLAHILIPLEGGPWEQVEDVDFDLLPMQFALKATHGCKMNYIVADKTKMDVEDCKKQVKQWLATTYGTYSVEPHYKDIPHRIYAEKYLANAEELMDYKFHCINGEPEFVLVCSDRKSEGEKSMLVTRDLFDMEWQPIYEIVLKKNEVAGTGNLPKPKKFEEMKEIARILSKDFQFVRVDLYELNDQVLFGELTFSPASCVFPHFTDKFIREMGEKLTL